MAQYGYWHIDIFPWMNWKSSSTYSMTRTVKATTLGMGYQACQAGGVTGKHIEWDVPLMAGTWTMTVIAVQQGASGIVTPSIDGVDLSSSDFSLGGSNNVVTQWTGISVITDSVKEVKFRTDSKNAGSSNYNIYPQLINFTRTA